MDVTIYQRNDLIMLVTVRDETGAALDLTGAALAFVVRDGAGQLVISKTVGAGITVADPVAGSIKIELMSTDTDLPVGDYRLELLVTDVEGARYTAESGRLTILPSLTA